MFIFFCAYELKSQSFSKNSKCLFALTSDLNLELKEKKTKNDKKKIYNNVKINTNIQQKITSLIKKYLIIKILNLVTIENFSEVNEK